LISAVVALLAFGAGSAPAATTSRTLEEAKTAAAASGKLVLVDASADW
jgi:hypothetical protein